MRKIISFQTVITLTNRQFALPETIFPRFSHMAGNYHEGVLPQCHFSEFTFRKNPQSPSIEYAANSFYQQLIGYGSRNGDMGWVKPRDHDDFFAWVTPSVNGTFLSDQLKNYPQLEHLDKEMLQKFIITTFFVRLSNGLPSNMVVTDKNKILNINYGRAFTAQGLVRKKGGWRETSRINILNVLFCCDVMNDVILKKVREDLLKIDVLEFIKHWINSQLSYADQVKKAMGLHKKDGDYANTMYQFFRVHDGQSGSVIPLLLHPSAIKTMYTQMTHVWNRLKNDDDAPTLLTLLKLAEPEIAHYYDCELQKNKSALQRFQSVCKHSFIKESLHNPRTSVTNLTAEQFMNSVWGIVPNEGNLNALISNRRVLNPEKFVDELIDSEAETELIQRITQDLKNGELSGFLNAGYSFIREKVIRSIDFGECSHSIQDQLFHQIARLKLAAGGPWRSLHIRNSVISDDKLKAMLNNKTLNYITELHLTGCPNLTGQIIKYARQLKNIEKIVLDDLSAMVMIGSTGKTSSKEHKHIRQLEVRNCKALTLLQIAAPRLRDLDIRGCRQLKTLNINKCEKLKNFSLYDADLDEVISKDGVLMDRNQRFTSEALQLAVELGDVYKLFLMAALGVDMNRFCSNKFSALHMAVMGLSLESIRLYTADYFTHRTSIQQKTIRVLHSLGANINSQTPDLGIAPIHIAAGKSNLSIFQLLLDLGADVRKRDYNGKTVAHFAAGLGSAEMIFELNRLSIDMNEKSREGFTPLHEAAGIGNTRTIQALSISGADINATTDFGPSPLLFAACAGKPEAVKQLKRLGGEVLLSNDNDEPIASYIFRNTNMDNNDAIRVIEELGIGLHTNSDRGYAPIHAAAFAGNRNMIRCLVQSHGVDVNMRSQNGRPALVLAVSSDKMDAAQELLRLGANVNLPDFIGLHPIHAAAIHNNASFIETLHRSGADINSRMNDGKTPLLIAAGLQRREAVRALIKLRADYNIADNQGNTPFSLILTSGSTNVLGDLFDLPPDFIQMLRRDLEHWRG